MAWTGSVPIDKIVSNQGSYVVWLAVRWSVGYPALTGGFQTRKKLFAKMVNPPTVTLAIALPSGFVASAVGLTAWTAAGGQQWVAPLRSAVECARRLTLTFALTLTY